MTKIQIKRVDELRLGDRLSVRGGSVLSPPIRFLHKQTGTELWAIECENRETRIWPSDRLVRVVEVER